MYLDIFSPYLLVHVCWCHGAGAGAGAGVGQVLVLRKEQHQRNEEPFLLLSLPLKKRVDVANQRKSKIHALARGFPECSHHIAPRAGPVSRAGCLFVGFDRLLDCLLVWLLGNV